MRAKFTIRDGLVLFSDNRPGSHATMFGPGGEALPFRGDHSSFDDKKKDYTWGFDYTSPLVNGDKVVFATADLEVVGVVEGSRIRSSAAKKGSVVERDEGGKPVTVWGAIR